MKKSKGHIAFVGDFEYLKVGEDIARAPLNNAFRLDGRRHARWFGPDRESTYKYQIQPHIDLVKKDGGLVKIDSKYKKKLHESSDALEVLLEDLRLDEGSRIPETQWVFTIRIPGADIDLHIAPEGAISRYRTYLVGISPHGKEPHEWWSASYEWEADRDWKLIDWSYRKSVDRQHVPSSVVKIVKKWIADQLPDKGYRKDFKSHRKV